MNRNPKLSIINSQFSIAQALLAALLFGMNAPFSKLLLGTIPPMFMAALLYLGAAAGMSALRIVSTVGRKRPVEANLTKGDAPWAVLMILLDILAPFLLMSGLRLTAAENASLLSNFELVATSVVALVIFREAIGARMWLAIGIITAASLVLCFDFTGAAGFSLSPGSLLILGACVCWGFENNCTGRLSARDPSLIVIIKGFGSGLGALMLALMTERIAGARVQEIAGALALGFVSWGLSIYFYVRAQRGLGAARTGMYYAAAPFIGVLLSWLVLRETPGLQFGVAMALMVAGTVLVVLEKHAHTHTHAGLIHEHRHGHDDSHHGHSHAGEADPQGEHSHLHEHDACEHAHEHRPDIHHRHGH